MITVLVRISISILFTFSLIQPLYGAESKLGPYTIVKELGKGDQARVYKAYDAQKKSVALKVFYTKSEMAEVHPERKMSIDSYFERDGSSKAANAEYEVGRRLNHPRIMKLYQKHEATLPTNEKVSYIALELVSGKNIAKTETGSLSKKASIALIRQLTSALRHSFHQGLIHDDLWSENIYVDLTGNLKLIDLGSFDPLPSLQKGEKARGTYLAYHKVILQVIKRLLQLGSFSSREEEKIIHKIEAAAKKGENCPISLEYRAKIEANLEALDNTLSTL